MYMRFHFKYSLTNKLRILAEHSLFAECLFRLSTSSHCLATINCQAVAGYEVRPVGGIVEDSFRNVFR